MSETLVKKEKEDQGMYYAKVDVCGINTSKLPVLSDEEKKDLLLKCSKGDENARTKLIDGNLRLVLSIVSRFASRGENLDDMFQVGCIGLIKAVDNFDTTHEVKFSTYAVPMIIGEMKRYLRDNSSLRVSRSMRDLAYKALSARERLTRLKAVEPTIDEISAELEKTDGHHSPAEIVCALESITQPVSLYDPAFTDGNGSESLSIMDQIKDENDTDDMWIEEIAIAEAMKKLPPREQKIINMRFYRNKTQMEIAGEIGISQAQVSRLEKGALEQIKKQL